MAKNTFQQNLEILRYFKNHISKVSSDYNSFLYQVVGKEQQELKIDNFPIYVIDRRRLFSHEAITGVSSDKQLTQSSELVQCTY